MKYASILATLVFWLTAGAGSAPTEPRTQSRLARSETPTDQTVWYFYRVRWGFQDEFLDLFQKNHYPVLKVEQAAGRFVAIKTYVPTYHGDGRADWTFAVSLTFKGPASPAGPDADEIARKLFPDYATFVKEEQRRFELLEAHWDVPLNEVNFETRKLGSR
ncbi:MAG: hypothetical protein ACRD1T_14630 [Acidimicrobiia bacterium]